MLDLVIGSQNGKNVYLRDVARVEDSIEERAQETFNNGTKGGMIVITETVRSELGEHRQEGTPETSGDTG